MAVPKKKTSKSRRNMRRSHLALQKINVIVECELKIVSRLKCYTFVKGHNFNFPKEE